MKDVVLNSGEVMTDAEFVRERGGDTYTDFIATREDLVSLAHKLVKEVLDEDFFLQLQVCNSWLRARDYKLFRLRRVMGFLPEVEAEIKEKLRVGYEKNEADAREFEEKSNEEYRRTRAGRIARRALIVLAEAFLRWSQK